MSSLLNLAKKVFLDEIEALKTLYDKLDESFIEIAKVIQKNQGKVIVTGMGKSGIIGRKIAATMSSTGTPAFSMHPADAFHGDLGMVRPSDIIILISNSGETDELLRLLSYAKNNNIQTIAITRDNSSSLAKNADYHICTYIVEEACPLSLAPTSSTTTTLVIGDALAATLIHLNDFKDLDFAQYHPLGSLGRKLLTRAKDLMQFKDLPFCDISDSVLNIIHQMTKGRFGLCIIKKSESLQGIVTDGDLRRGFERFGSDLLNKSIKEIMTSNPIVISPQATLEEVEEIFVNRKIVSLLVGSNDKVQGIIQIYDIERSFD